MTLFCNAKRICAKCTSGSIHSPSIGQNKAHHALLNAVLYFIIHEVNGWEQNTSSDISYLLARSKNWCKNGTTSILPHHWLLKYFYNEIFWKRIYLFDYDKKYFAVPRPPVLPVVAVCGWCKWKSDLDPHSLVQIGLQLFKWGHFHIFSLSYKLTSDNLWPWYMTFDRMNIWRCPYYINKPSLVPIRLQLFK